MAYFTGRTGALYLTAAGTGDPNPVGSEKAYKLRDWKLDTTVEMLETTTVDTAVKEYTPGVSSASGSATLLYYRSEVGETGVQFDQFLNKVMKTTTAGMTETDRVGMILRVGNTPTGGDNKDDIAFNAWITGASLSVSTGELSSVSLQFSVDGPFREVINA
jgi:hypothetical protein